jgi:hypothetical protein
MKIFLPLVETPYTVVMLYGNNQWLVDSENFCMPHIHPYAVLQQSEMSNIGCLQNSILHHNYQYFNIFKAF